MSYPTHCPHCQKPIFESSETLKNGALATVAATLPRGLKWLSRVIDPVSFRNEFRIGSLQDMGEWIGRYHGNGHGGRAYDKSAVYRYENKLRKLTDDVKESYKSIARAIMHEHTGGRVGLRIVLGPRRWKFTPVVICKCGMEFIPERISETMCKRCRRAK